MLLMNEAFKTWNRILKLQLTSAEVMITSTQTISQRTSLFSENIASPQNVEDELFRMSNEKFQAATQSSSAIFEGYVQLGNKLFEASTNCFTQSFNELLSAPFSMHTFAGPQMTYWNALRQNSLKTFDITNATLSIMENSIKPIHSRTSSNAKRLTR